MWLDPLAHAHSERGLFRESSDRYPRSLLSRGLNMTKVTCLLAAVLCASALLGCSRDCSSPADGCPCDPLKDAPFCDGWSDPSVGYTCLGGHWSTGPDGPCMPVHDGGRSIDVAMSVDLATSEGRTTGLDSVVGIDGLESLDASTTSQ
jgi:hypothetical protein